MHRIALAACLSLGLLGVAHPVHSKCPMQQYRIEGSVRVPPSVDPGSISVYIFLEGASRTSELPRSPGESDHVTLDADGSFVFYPWLHTDSGEDGGRPSRGKDACKRKAEFVDVVVIGEGVEAKRMRAQVVRPADELPNARVPPIVLEKVRKPSPGAD